MADVKPSAVLEEARKTALRIDATSLRDSIEIGLSGETTTDGGTTHAYTVDDIICFWRDAERALAEARAENEALEKKLNALAPHGTCGCSYDKQDDLCMHHSPQVMQARAENERLREALDHPYGFTMPEIIEIGKAILPHLSSETTSQIGSIAHDVAASVTRVMRARAALNGKGVT